jgi:hypothetical protein
MKKVLEFVMPEDSEEFRLADNGAEAHFALSDILNEIFRPVRKHGYADEDLNKLLEDEKVREAISLLEDKFHGILNDRNIKI